MSGMSSTTPTRLMSMRPTAEELDERGELGEVDVEEPDDVEELDDPDGLDTPGLPPGAPTGGWKCPQ